MNTGDKMDYVKFWGKLMHALKSGAEDSNVTIELLFAI